MLLVFPDAALINQSSMLAKKHSCRSCRCKSLFQYQRESGVSPIHAMLVHATAVSAGSTGSIMAPCTQGVQPAIREPCCMRRSNGDSTVIF